MLSSGDFREKNDTEKKVQRSMNLLDLWWPYWIVDSILLILF